MFTYCSYIIQLYKSQIIQNKAPMDPSPISISLHMFMFPETIKKKNYETDPIIFFVRRKTWRPNEGHDRKYDLMQLAQGES